MIKISLILSIFSSMRCVFFLIKSHRIFSLFLNVLQLLFWTDLSILTPFPLA